MELHFDINLQRMSMVASALALWERKDVKLKVKEFFYMKGGLNTKNKWLNLVKEVLKELKRGFLPSILYCQLLYVIRDIGLKIYGWFRFMKKSRMFRYTHRKQIFDIYTKNLVWTHYGTIDEVKTLRSWMNDKNVDYSKAFSMACRCCLPEDVKVLWNLIPEHVKSSRYKDTCSRYGTHIIAYWCSYQNEFQDDLIAKLIDQDQGYLNLYDEAGSLDENMLTLSARKIYNLAVQHFWNKISIEEKERNICNCLKKLLQISYITFGDYHIYRMEQCAEMLIFFLNQLTGENKEQFFQSLEYRVLDTSSHVRSNEAIDTIFKTLTFMWPWQELLIPVAEHLKIFLTIHEYENIFNELCRKMNSEYEFGLPVKNSTYQRIIFGLWQIIPSNFKLKISISIVEELFEVWDVSNIKMIINDDEVAPERLNLLTKGYEKFVSLVRSSNNEMIDQFIKEIVIPNKWDRIIHNNVKTLYDLIMNGEFVLNDKFLEWASNHKEKLNIDVLCYYFIVKNQFHEADKLLLWKFNDREKIKNFKNRLFNPDIERVRTWYTENFSCDHVYKLWSVRKEDVNKAITESSNYLSWLFESEDEVVAFKNEKFFSRIMKKKSCYFLERNSFNLEIIDDFLMWCSCRENELKQIKDKFVKFGAPYRCGDYIQNRELHMARKVLEWAIESEDERQNFIANLFLDDEETYSLLASKMLPVKYFIGVHNEIPSGPSLTEKETVEIFKEFIELWVKPIKDKNAFKKKLLRWKKDSDKREDEDISDILDTDNSTTDNYHSDYTDNEDYDDGLHIKNKNINIFLNLLSSMCDV